MITTKIPLQEKIAELEGAIRDLEKRVKRLEDRSAAVFTECGSDMRSEIRRHWDRMWEEFDLLFKAAFK